MPKAKLKPFDGLGPLEIKKIRQAVRLVWHRSHARKLVVKRCTDAEGFQVCEQCLQRTPKLRIDHIEACGDVDEGFLKRMFAPSEKLQGLCHSCHNYKTRMERTK